MSQRIILVNTSDPSGLTDTEDKEDGGIIMDNKKVAPKKIEPAPAPEPAATPEAPAENKFALNAEDLEGDKFDGMIVKAGLAPTDYGEKIVLELKVPFFEDTMKLRFSPSTRKRSKWGFFLQGLKACNVQLDALEDLEGTRFTFERRDFEMGKDFNPITGLPIPIKFLGKEQ